MRTSNMMTTSYWTIAMSSALLLLSLGVAHGQANSDCVDQNLEYLHFNVNLGATSLENCSWVGEELGRCDIEVTRQATTESEESEERGREKTQKNDKTRRLAKKKNTKANPTEATQTLGDICPDSCLKCSTVPAGEEPANRDVVLSIEGLTVEEKNMLDLTSDEMKEINQSKRSHEKSLRKKKKNRKPCPCPEGGHGDSGDGNDGDDDDDDRPTEPSPSPSGPSGDISSVGPTFNFPVGSGVPQTIAPTSASSTLTTSSGSFSSSSSTSFTSSFFSSGSFTGSTSSFTSSTGSTSSTFSGSSITSFSSSFFTSSSSSTSTTSTTTINNAAVEFSDRESTVNNKKSRKTLAVFLSIVPVLLLLLVFCCLLRRKRRKAREGKGLDDTDDSDDENYPIHKTKSASSSGSKGFLKVLGMFNGRRDDPQTDVRQCTSSFCVPCSPPGSPRQVMSVDSYENLYTNSTFKDEDERYVVKEVEC